MGKGYKDGRNGKDRQPPNTASKWTFASPVGRGPGSSARLHKENKEYNRDYSEGRRDRDKHGR